MPWPGPAVAPGTRGSCAVVGWGLPGLGGRCVDAPRTARPVLGWTARHAGRTRGSRRTTRAGRPACAVAVLSVIAAVLWRTTRAMAAGRAAGYLGGGWPRRQAVRDRPIRHKARRGCAAAAYAGSWDAGGWPAPAVGCRTRRPRRHVGEPRSAAAAAPWPPNS